MDGLADKKIIGEYLRSEILKKYKSVRSFSKAYLEMVEVYVDEEAINRMSNRLSQILNGKQGKTIQVHDLPIFSKLLGLSYEQILSAGSDNFPTSNHLTNYSVACSNDPKDWEQYIKHKDNIILNADEYGKTIIDYALSFNNYELLKYLMDKEYIWFIGKDAKEYWHSGFGAGTSIKINKVYRDNYNILDVRLKEQYELRTQMLALAITKNDLDMLEKLHARETPELYKACEVAYYHYDETEELKKQFDLKVVETISDANGEILSYFSEEFRIENKNENLFMYPYISNLIELLIRKKNHYVITLLKKAIKHNKTVYDKMSNIYNVQKKYYKEKFNYDGISDDELNKSVKYMSRLALYFIKETHIVRYHKNDGKKEIVSNLNKIKNKDSHISVYIKSIYFIYIQKYIHLKCTKKENQDFS